MFKSIEASNASCNGVVRFIDTGSAYASGGIYLYDTTDFSRYHPDSSAFIARFPLSYPSFIDATDGTSYAWPITDATANYDSTIRGFGVFNRDSIFGFGGSVSSTSGSDMRLDRTVVSQGNIITLDEAFYIVL